jgi:predicted transcriptional regulator of viral defense system
MKSASKIAQGSLDAWVDSLPSKGRYSYTREEVMGILGVGRIDFNRMAGRLAKHHKIARVHGSFYAVIPLEHAAVGMIPADWFITDLMRYLKQPFYMGGLTAAEYHGAAHQRSQWFQVVTTKPVRDISCRGVGIRFLVKQNAARVPTQAFKGVTGYIPVSTPEATALDLIRYQRRLGGLDHALTVLHELGEAVASGALVIAADQDGNVAYAQRLGYLLDLAGYRAKTGALAKWVARKKPFDTKLEPSLPARGTQREKRWHLLVNVTLESDLV